MDKQTKENGPLPQTESRIVRLLERGYTRRQASDMTRWSEEHIYNTWLRLRPNTPTARQAMVLALETKYR